MAVGPICIWTSSGMICDSKSYEMHFKGAKKCRVVKVKNLSKKQQAMLKDVHADLRPAGVPKVYGRVVALMKLAKVDDNTDWFRILTE